MLLSRRNRNASLLSSNSIHSNSNINVNHRQQNHLRPILLLSLQKNKNNNNYNFSQIRYILSDAVQKRVDTMVAKHDEIMQRLSQGEASSLAKDLSLLAPVARLQQKLYALHDEMNSMKELLEEAISTDDKVLEEESQEELRKIQVELSMVEKRIIDAILPKHEDDGEAAIIEVRAGTGGDEAALFAAELMEAYAKTAKARGWKVEILHKATTDIGGIKEASLSITASGGGGSHGYTDDDHSSVDPMVGLGPYGFFKFESGVHRVQRVPVNDVRIHTSACSVGVLPSPSDERSDELLPMSELKIETMRGSGPGGQSVNTTDSAVRITHIPTGITASIQDERSQHKNKEKALKLIAARVQELQREAAARELGEARNSLMGGGDRSERIRTYNFPQDRVTDHRCKVSEHGIVKLLAGAYEDGLVATFAPLMRSMAREELLQELEDKRK